MTGMTYRQITIWVRFVIRLRLTEPDLCILDCSFRIVAEESSRKISKCVHLAHMLPLCTPSIRRMLLRTRWTWNKGSPTSPQIPPLIFAPGVSHLRSRLKTRWAGLPSHQARQNSPLDLRLPFQTPTPTTPTYQIYRTTKRMPLRACKSHRCLRLSLRSTRLRWPRLDQFLALQLSLTILALAQTHLPFRVW